jgi:alpha-beta hydrolase superfamily lysophospholipase
MADRVSASVPQACPPDRTEALEASLGVPSGPVKLYLEHFLPPGPPSGVLLAVHGYGVHCGLYRHVGATFARAGWAVTQFDCRGHGQSTGRRGHVARFSDYGDDLAAVAARARSLAPPGVPLVLLGHSHGATIALDSVLRGAVTPDRMVAATPFLGLTMPVPLVKRAISPLMSRVWPTLTLANGIRSVDLSRNPEWIAVRDADPLVHHVATARWFHELQAAQARILAGAAALRVPTLLLVAGRDRIVSVSAELARVLADVASWLRTPIGADLDRAPAVVESII